MNNFDEVIWANNWLKKVIEEGKINENLDDIISTIKDTISFLKWADERILELERRLESPAYFGL